MSKEQPEYILQRQVCQYLNMAYPKVLFLSDTVASVRLSIPQANRNKAIQKQGFKTPDLIIFQPNKNFHGLFIELKAKSPYQKNGHLYSDPHIQGQDETLRQLSKLDYLACFAWGFDQVKAIIDHYMKDVIA